MYNKISFPKVLVVGINAWREDGTAHTLMDIFSCWDPEKVALVFTRADMPNTHAAKHFFQISESQVMKSLLKPWVRVGCEVKNTSVVKSADVQAEHERYTKAHKNHAKWMTLARELVWKFGHWKTAELRKFVKDFNPDILFIPIYPTVYMGWIQRYIMELTGKPTVCYLADDNYSYDSCKDWMDYIHRYFLRKQVKPIATTCKQMFVIVDKEKKDTDNLFGTDSVILTKSIDFTGKSYEHREPNKPLRFVYTGSLIIGRDKTMAQLADAINKLNGNDIKAEFYIYSQTTPDDQIMARINTGASHYCGRVSREEVLKIQKDADIVVFGEALEGKDANVARLSFSTKITDYLRAGKCILAIGKDYIAPIDYFQRNESALVAHTAEEIEAQVKRLMDSPSLIDEYGKKAFDCAVKNHKKEMMTERFISTMLKASK